MIETFSAVGKSWLITKAWSNDDGSVNIEGWVSTNKQDAERDILEPETFAGETLDGYFQRGAPISCEHNTRDIPVGYMLKSALVRDGQIFQEADNFRHDTSSFKYFDGTGTGWYGLGVIDEPVAIKAVGSGKLSSFSWIGLAKAWTPIPGGGKHFSSQGGISPLLEATITAYPINTSAIMRVAKSYGYAQNRLMLTPAGVDSILHPMKRNK